MRILMVGLMILFGQGCIKDDYFKERSQFGGVMTNAEERFKCEMDSLRSGCSFIVPRQEVN
jgi:hypothetical protein